MAPEPEFCTASEAAEILDVHSETVRRWAREGRLDVMLLPSGRMRFRRSTVLALLNETRLDPARAVDSEPVAS
jgi:excisionase family DNA binding protein